MEGEGCLGEEEGLKTRGIYFSIHNNLNMVRNIDLFFDPQSREYVVVSEGHHLRMSENEFKDIRGSMNGIALAFLMKSKKK